MYDNPLFALATAAHVWRTRALPADVDHDARRAVLDWFAALLPGCAEDTPRTLSQALITERGQGAAFSYVDSSQGAARHAALLNGTTSHTAEFDDIFRDGGYHPGSPTISSALAVAQAEGATADAFRRAVIGGYEVGCRIAIALQPSHYRDWHITGTVGTMGAAVSTAMLKGCDQLGIAHAIAIASSFAGGHQENLQGKGRTKPLHCGHAAEAGVLAGTAAAAGITGSLDSLHAPHGYAAASSDGTGNWAAGLDGLGDWTPISRMTFKNHGCCGHIFAALDGLRALQSARAFGPGDVARIEVHGYGATASICDRMEVADARDARFSVQYCVAALLHLGSVRLAAFTPEALARPDLRAFMPKVSVSEDLAFTAAYPARRQARLKVTLTDGTILNHAQPTRKGDPDDPLNDAELFAKYDELAATVLDRAVADRLKHIVMASDDLPGLVSLRNPNQMTSRVRTARP
jgi:2-methylcitrate dehydratase PrpD